MRFGDPDDSLQAASELEELGFGAIWVPGGIDSGVLGDVDQLLGVTQHAVICTGIINVWKHEPADIFAWWSDLPPDHQSRTLLGLGISHGPIIGEQWQKPLGKMRAYVEELTTLGVPSESLCLAALGPKMIELSGASTTGAHPYLVTAEHSAIARDILGEGPLLAPEQGVIMETDPAKARQIGREGLANYRHLPNYQNSWKRLGFSDDEIADLSDRLIDGLFAWGAADAIGERIGAHHAAGADHVCIQLISAADTGMDVKRAQWRELADSLFD